METKERKKEKEKIYTTRKCRGKVLQMCKEITSFLKNAICFKCHDVHVSVSIHNSLCFIFSLEINIHFQT